MPDAHGYTSALTYRVLAFGDASILPSEPGVEITNDPDGQVDLVVVLPDGGDPFPAMAENDLLLKPVLDLEAGLSRADVRDTVQPTAIPRALQATRGLSETVESLPSGTGGSGDPRLVPLAYAWTRQVEITPAYRPTRPEMLAYPALEGLDTGRYMLSELANAGLLTFGHFVDRTYSCDSCGSARLIAQEVCPSCHSAQLTSEDLLHHYRCAWQAPRSEFRAMAGRETPGRDLACPKCRREPRHYGVDYDAAGTASTCGACGNWTTEPAVQFRCADCTHVMRGTEASLRDWYAYRLTDAARNAVRRGLMPDVQLGTLLADAAGGCTPRDLALLTDWGRRIRNRYGNPFSMLRVGTAGAGQGREREEVLSFVADTVKEMTRTCDAVCALGDEAIVYLPETGDEGSEIVRGRIQERLESYTRSDADVTVTRYSADDCDPLIEALTG